ncbi:MAG TPA: FAD-dependent oxidoreductase, partial [Parvularculaceae bacterium]|nr:FAD-dependent oxidoreductase [Parvularculaceae bacterium]
IGAGQAGAQGAASLREEGFKGAITLIGEERAPPYQRPPLSKAYLAGALAEDRLYLRPREFYDKNDVDLRPGARATAIDRGTKTVALASGETLSYDKLLIATGAPPRRLNVPGADLPGVAYLRTIADSDHLRATFANAKRLVIVGAGYIGLEVAAVARKAGLVVTVLELAARALSRVAPPEVSNFYRDLHRAAGVDLRFGAALSGFEGNGALEAALLADREAIPCDAALICVGAAPATALAEASGLKVDNGLWVDETAASEDPSIWAAGDVTNHPSLLYGRRVRLESVPNAIDQAKAAAANMAGRRMAYDAVPWFWSDQYDLKLQTAGISAGAGETVTRGDPKSKRYAVFSLNQGRLLAVDAINDPASFLVGKKLIGLKASPDPKVLADPEKDLKSLLA